MKNLKNKKTKKMKKITLLSILLSLAIMLSACGSESSEATETTPQETTTASTTETEEKEEEIAILQANFSDGNADPSGEQIKEYDLPYTGDLTVEKLTEGLSELTGLDFFLEDVMISGNTVYIDWASNSTLVAGIDDREFLEDFHFYDHISMRWFMMDSLYHTIINNLDYSEVYYSTEGGYDIYFEDFSIPANIAYQGSAFYYNHSGNAGELTYEANPEYFVQTVGTWFENYDEAGNYIIIDEYANFSYVVSDGQILGEGYLTYNPETSEYSMYIDPETVAETFTFVNASEFVFDSDGLNFAKIYPNIPVLVSQTYDIPDNFYQVQPNYFGGYLYVHAFQNEEIFSLSIAVNSPFRSYVNEANELTPVEDALMEELINDMVYLATDGESFDNLTISRDMTYDFYHDVYTLEWTMGDVSYNAVFFDTYAHSYIYVFGFTSDVDNDTRSTYVSELNNLTLQMMY